MLLGLNNSVEYRILFNEFVTFVYKIIKINVFSLEMRSKIYFHDPLRYIRNRYDI